MKTKLTFLISFFITVFFYSQTNLYSTQSQALPENAILEENSLQFTFSNLDKSKIDTGLLLDAAIEFADLKKYNGTPTDISFTSAKIIGDVYNTLIMSKISSNQGTLKPPADFQNEWFKMQYTDVLPIGGVYFKYNQFSESNNSYFQAVEETSATARISSISSSSLAVSSDNMLSDVYTNGIWQNPYEISNVFALAPIANSHNKLNFKVIFPSSLFLSNYANEINMLEVKFSDEENFRTVNYGQLMDVNYPAIGEYTWTYKLTLNNGQVLYSKNKFQVTSDLEKYVNEEVSTSTISRSSNINSQYKKVVLETFPYILPLVNFTEVRPKLTLYIKLKDGQTQITNPFIVVEGFDSGHITAPRKEGGDNNIDGFLKSVDNNPFYKTLLESKLDEFDIIYVDWGIGTDYIQNNAELLKKAIRWVNANKSGTNKNIVMGQSMGGLVARYALKDMEDKGENHDTKLYISHDSPHLGANTPLGIQYMMRNVSQTFLKSPIIAGINYILSPIFYGVPISEVLTIADTPASRQMLINYVDKNYNIDNSVHNAWQNVLKAKGYPQQTRNVAISNGSECGTDQNMQNLVTMHHMSKGWFVDLIGAFIGGLTQDFGQFILSVLPGKSRYYYDFEARPMTGLNENKELYKGSIIYKKDILWFIPAQNTLLSGSNYQPQGILPIDKYGGGKYQFPKSSLPKFIGDYLTVSDFSFIPTPSALDAYSGNKILTENDYQKTYSPVDDASIVPFSNFVIEKMGGNNRHIYFSDRNGQFIINQLSLDSNIQNEKLTTAYLCGSKIKIGGEGVICGNDNMTYTTGFAPYISWSVLNGSDLIDVTSPFNQPQISFTPKAGANGFVKLQALLIGNGASNTVTKNIWIGKPNVYIEPDENNTNYAIFYVKSSDLYATLADQGVTATDVIWKRLDNGATRTGFSYFANGPGYNWSFDVEVKAKNICGEYITNGTITPPPPPSCDNYRIAKTNNNNEYTVARIIDPTCPQTRFRTTSTSKKEIETYQITVANSLGNIVISKNGNTFDLNNFPTGSYFVKVIKENKIVVSQTLIKK